MTLNSSTDTNLNNAVIVDLLSSNPFLADSLKSELISVHTWPNNSQALLVSILQRSGIGGGELMAYARAILSLIHSLEASERGDFGQIQTWLHTSLTDPDREFGKMITVLLPDVREAFHKHTAPNEAWATLVEFESKLFPYLPSDELEQIVSTQVMSFLRVFDFLAEFRKNYLLAKPVYDNGIWCEPFLPLLKKNRELLGKEITIDNKQLPPTVTNWLQDFDYFVKQPIANVQSFDVVKYVNNSPNGKVLDAGDRKLLLKLLEFYIWLHDPFVTHEDAVALGIEVDEKAESRKQLETNVWQQVGQVPNKNLQIPNAAPSQHFQTNLRSSTPNLQPHTPIDIDRVVKESLLPQPKERLELADRRQEKEQMSTVRQYPITKESRPASDQAESGNRVYGSSLVGSRAAVKEQGLGTKVSEVSRGNPSRGVRVANPNEFMEQLNKIKQEVMDKRKVKEAEVGRSMDGMQKTSGQAQDDDVVI